MGVSDDEWWEHGLCQWNDPSIWDGHARGAQPKDKWALARHLCGKCPVQPQCLEWVLSMPREQGSDQAFAAGHTPKELDALRKRRGVRELPPNTRLNDPIRWNR